jgi:hypothetical protein
MNLGVGKMDEIRLIELKKFAIKSDVKTSLIECLELFSLNKMRDIAEYYGITGISKAKKLELIPLLFETITKNFLDSYIYFTPYQEEGFNNIIEKNIVEDVEIFCSIYYLLYYSGIAYYFYNNDKLYITIPTEIIEIYNNANLNELNKIKEKNQGIFKYMMALCNIYGIYDSEQFIKIFNMYHKEKMTEKEFVRYAEIMNTKQSYFSIDSEDYNNCLVFVGDDEDGELFEMLCGNIGRPYYNPTKDEIDFYANEAYQDTEQFKEFKKYLIDNKLVDENKIEDFVDEIRCSCQVDKSPSDIMEIVNGYGIIFKGMKDANEMMGLIIDMSNHERKWSLKGYSPNMIKSNSINPNIIKVTKIGRNEPCPCGSGKKYKKCCGK